MGIGLLTAPQRVYATEVPDTSTGTDSTTGADSSTETDSSTGTDNSTEKEEIVYTQVQVSKDKTYTKSLKDKAPTLTMDEMKLGFNSKGKVKVTWENSYESPSGNKVTCEVQMADNSKFKNAKKFTTKNTYINIARSKFGKNGGTMYFRVRFYDTFNGKKVYSAWSEVKDYNFVKINKKNFPGMYELLKKGGCAYEMESNSYVTQVYDTNKDGWLDPKEIFNISNIENRQQYENHQPLPMIQVSSLEGIKYFKALQSICLAQYSGTKADFSKNQQLFNIDIYGLTSKSIQVISPTARTVSVEPTYSNKGFEKMDLSKCKNAQTIYVYVSKNTHTLKLPTYKKNLRFLSISDYNVATLDFNSYVNLEQIYLYECDLTKLNINKCKNLHYLYFYYCHKISGIDVRANKNLRGIDAAYCDKLTKSKIVAPVNTKVTEDQGKWFMQTEEYKKDGDRVNSIGNRLNIKGYLPRLEAVKMTSKGQVQLSWMAGIPYMQDAKVTYEVQMADNPQFKKAKKFTSNKKSLTINKNKFGKNGGTYYFRVRLCDSSTGVKNYTGWSGTEVYTCVKSIRRISRACTTF